MGARLRVALVLVAWLAWAPKLEAQQAAEPESAETTEEVARQHFQLGRAQYASGNFKEAAESFERAYKLSKREMLWYNIYLAFRDLGDNKKAADALRNFLTRVPDVDNRAQLEARLASLDRQVQEEEGHQKEEEALRQQAAAEQAQGSQQVALTTASSHDTATEPPPKRSIVPYVLMGSGGALIVGGVIFGVMSSSKYSELESKCPNHTCDPSFKSLASQGKTFALVSDLLLFGGIGVAASGGVLWFLNRSSHSEQSQALNLSCGPYGCTASGAF
jgi:tetratricopeptide (TPR) repeat protein